ncbi:MAG: DUF2786 domain-containing protein [Acidimicrobiales bacterium]|nr:DUF2786 domain-containing protein [Acidimicrobiales bacterium]
MTTNHRSFDPPAEDLAGLEKQLIELLAHHWARGWMPADILAAVAVRQPTRCVAMTAGLILLQHERAGYDDRLTPRWCEQLASVRAVAGDGDWLRSDQLGRLYSDAINVFLELRFLPPLLVLGPAPGEAAAGRVRRRNADADPHDPAPVDEDVLRRVRGLLAKAEASEFDAEAEAFTAKAQAMIAEYSLADALRTEESGADTAPDAIRLAVSRPYEREKFGLLSIIARANRSRAVLHQHLGLATVFGFAIDLRAIELLYTSLLVQAVQAMQTAKPDHRTTAAETKAFRRSFLDGFTFRVHERLEQASSTASAQTEAAHGSPLAPVLVRREAAVEAAVEDAFPRLSKLRAGRGAFSDTGFGAGMSAADRADLGVRRPLAS